MCRCFVVPLFHLHRVRVLDMEGALTARDRVGIQDFVLLDVFLHMKTYIGTLLVSVNPYKELDIYSKKQMDIYMGVNFFELPPHIFALADNAYHTMLAEANNHFILISGESGAGKTEASKKILQYYAVSCPSTTLLDNVRDRMLLSNPVLEAFGNSKTLKNDNSSRFGKYMDIQFDIQGDAVGGHILGYLLEKSRVVHQNHRERNFHIFYQLVKGGEEDLLHQLGLESNCQHYSYLVQGECANVASINDKNDWKTVRNALSVIEFDERDIQHLLGVIASVLHLGNVQFEPDSKGYATLNNSTLHNNTIPFTVDHAIYARDALAKAIYGRTFTWLVNKINDSMENKDSSCKTVIGLLDIYGFEVFYVNSFEQFCINYCNEKLQQLFIQLTLKSEQEEYEAENIGWEPVQFFNNKIICDLVEEKHRGIISVLDEECLRPGEATDLTFLERLEEKLDSHPHFVTHKLADKKTRKTLERGDFRLLHYAGEVTYCVVGFLSKNNDLLYRNIKDVSLQVSTHVASQFKSSLLGLTDILMSKEPWYVRCLKSNESQQPGQFDDVLVRHQVKYLGLMEHLRVRRAGFAYRCRYDVFLQRYKPLCPATWPYWRGVAAEGVEVLVQHLGYLPDEYKMGRTKIFIRHPRTLFATEDAFEVCKHDLGKDRKTKINQEVLFICIEILTLLIDITASRIQTCWRGVQARKAKGRRQWAVKVIKKFIKGYMARGEAKTTDNSEYLAFVRQNYLNRLKDNLPKMVLDKTSWLTPPPVLTETSEILRQLHMRLMVRKYIRGITAQQKAQLQLKGITSVIFKGKKDSYPQSVSQPYVDTRISEQDINMKVLQMIRHEGIKYSIPIVKYDRNGFKARPRQLILTQTAAYVVDDAKIKQRVLYTTLKGEHPACCGWDGWGSSLSDLSLTIASVFQGVLGEYDYDMWLFFSVKFQMKAGKEGIVEFSSGQESMVYKDKNGHLMVVSDAVTAAERGLVACSQTCLCCLGQLLWPLPHNLPQIWDQARAQLVRITCFLLTFILAARRMSRLQ
uniref:Myosin motor domain-containing protein n=1 Tax=Oncorhynchus tshawytscha TaxID=74940 RepID=A0A8C8MI89_ONCTS